MHSSKKNSPLASSTEFSRFSQILPMPKSTTWPKTSHGYLKPGKSSTLVTLEQKLLKKIAMLKQSSVNYMGKTIGSQQTSFYSQPHSKSSSFKSNKLPHLKQELNKPTNNSHKPKSHFSSGFFKTEMRFWQFWIESKVITYVRYGMIQPDGRLKERAVQKQHHSNGTDARSFIENLIDKKIKSGYEGWMR